MSNETNHTPQERTEQRNDAIKATRLIFSDTPDLETESPLPKFSGLDITPEDYEAACTFFENHIKAREMGAVERRSPEQTAALGRTTLMGQPVPRAPTFAEIAAAKDAIETLRELGPMTAEEKLAEIEASSADVNSKKPPSPWAQKVEQTRDSDAISPFI